VQCLMSMNCTNRLPNAAVPTGFCPKIWATGLSNPRQILVVAHNELLVLENGKSSITAVFDDNGDGFSDLTERITIANAAGLNHAMEYNNGFLYASSPSTVFRWRFNPGNRSKLGNAEVAIRGLPVNGHSSRTLRFAPDGKLYVQSGSYSNVDNDYSHAQIRLFTLNRVPLTWEDGELMFYGMRNEVGVAWDSEGRLWGVENGVDNLARSDLGGNIKEDNPSEEVNIFSKKGFYGYPYCWSEGKLASQYAKGPGTQWVHPQFMNKNPYNDNWCKENSIKPVWNMQAHTAPLDILFYYNNTFPATYRGNAFITQHGSWNRVVPVGYRVITLKLDPVTKLPVSEAPFLYHNSNDQRWSNNFRPVGLGIKKCIYGDCLYVSSDASGQIVEISYQP